MMSDMSFPLTKASFGSAISGGGKSFRTMGTIGITTNHLAERGT